jgi:hypothetical protein
MRRIAVALLLCACLAACIEQHEGPGVVGSSDDVTTPPGEYVGYRVVRPCATSTWTDVGVIGTGTIELTQTDEIAAAGQELRAQIADLPSVWGWGGYGLVCEAGLGTSISLSDWRDVDTVIARVGDYLRERDYKLQVGIAVSSIPVPHASE